MAATPGNPKFCLRVRSKGERKLKPETAALEDAEKGCKSENAQEIGEEAPLGQEEQSAAPAKRNFPA